MDSERAMTPNDVRGVRGRPPYTPAVIVGYYTHWKGGKYYVLGVALSTETQAPEVVYMSVETRVMWRRPLYDDPAKPEAERCGWFDPVKKPEYTGPRFTLDRMELWRLPE